MIDRYLIGAAACSTSQVTGNDSDGAGGTGVSGDAVGGVGLDGGEGGSVTEVALS
ncbi:MAG TPA: hypothetical protein VLN49_17245 [Gemmatimonadaceae bacterium]|nr:hypothetical protein [Gemmatimonadaceae bacterium]